MNIFLLVLLALLPAAQVRAAEETFYVGTYTDHAKSQGIYVGTLDPENGKLGPLRLAAAVQKDPTFLALSPDRRFLFAALSDAVASYQIQPDGTLLALNRQPSGPDTCHVCLDRTGHELFSASYDAGTISAFPIQDGGLIGPRTAFVAFHGSGPNADRQKGPHAHSVYVDPENHFLYACDLGSDRLWIFRLGENGELIPATPPAAVAPPGSGPRHLAFSPDGRFVYVANELGVSTSVFSRAPTTGALTLIGTEPNIDPGWPKGTGSAEISFDPSGRWLYVSTRLRDMMTVFSVGPDPAAQTMSMPPLPSPDVAQKRFHRGQILPCPVTFPRSFALDPSGQWLVVAGQTDSEIAVLKLDSRTGQLTPTPERIHVGSPVCVLFTSSLPPAAP